MAERPFQPVPNTPLVADPTGDAIWKRWLQGLQRFLGDAVRGPGSSTDNAVARWNGTTGTFLNNSGVIIDDSNNVSGIVNLTTTGSTILGDASADTLTINAGTWTFGNNFIATRAAGTLAAGATSLCDFQSTFTGHSGGTTIARPWAFTAVLQGANNVDRTNALTQTVNHSGSGTLTLARSINNNVLVSSAGTITTAHGVESTFNLSSSGNIGTAAYYYAEQPTFSSTGAITTLYGVQSNITGGSSVTNAIAFYARDMAASTVMTGMELALSAGTGKKNLNITGTADNSLAGPLYLAQDNLTQQTASAMYAGTGAPNNANGSNGDFYLRGNGTVAGSNIVYHKEAGAWVALTGGGGGGASGTTVEVNLGTPKFTGKFTITDASISATSKVQCWQAPGPYTGKGTLADEAMMQPVQVIAVAPATGSAVVYWQTPPYVAMSQQLSNGKFGAAGATFDRLMNQRTPAVFTPTRIGKVRGNVKFTYTILT
jgi:hypothetical protein